MSDDLVAFLRARYDEEQAQAEKQPDVDDYGWQPWEIQWGETGTYDSYSYVRIAKARVLGEVKAKRRALDHYQAVRNHARNDEAYILAEGAVAKQIQIAALPYADHPEYRAEWRP